jgi:D-sedoheptulose 7-phosphate isomerase
MGNANDAGNKDHAMQDRIAEDLRESIAAIEATIRDCLPPIAQAAEAIIECYAQGGMVLIAGNGGSAADAQHFVGEMLGWFLDKNRGPLPAIALTTDTSVLTSISNDASVEVMFSRQLEALAAPEDVFIALSTSGESPNILRAVETAHAIGARTVALCGPQGSLAQKADIAIAVPAGLTPHVQIAHAVVLHAICRMVDEREW